jgi:hypothetical protein
MSAKPVKGTETLVKQTATHMSKLLAGESVGGFPGFEPPDDDEKYRQKIRNQSYTSGEANHWIVEINSFLAQLVRKYPGMTLVEILRRAGLTKSQIDNFITNLRNVHIIAETYDISPRTFEKLDNLMKKLGVEPW